jgi:inner membrane protein
MDSLTHIALGACMGEAFAGHKVGKKAMLWGALAQSIPDVDFIASFWLNTSSNLLAHRGFAHSIIFSLAATLLLTYFAEKWHRPHNISFTRWAVFFGAVILAHIFLDAFNNYGVGWFEPFSHYRISFNIIYVADPFFSLIPGICLLMLIVLRSFKKQRKIWWRLCLGFCSLYLCYCVINKIMIDRDVKKIIASQQIPYHNYFTTPAPLQSWLWFIVAQSDNGYYVGYRSVFDGSKEMPLQYFPQQKYLLDSVEDKKQTDQLIRFSKGYYTVEKRNDTLIFNDLRLGQELGWENPKANFAFHYYVEPDLDNTLVVQRGRFAGWKWSSLPKLYNRIMGKPLY